MDRAIGLAAATASACDTLASTFVSSLGRRLLCAHTTRLWYRCTRRTTHSCREELSEAALRETRTDSGTCSEGQHQDLTDPRPRLAPPLTPSTRDHNGRTMSSTAKLFSSPGFGHIDPSVGRGQLRKEIDAAMNRVDKLLKNSNIEAAERIQRIEDLKDEINQKKARIAEIKQPRSRRQRRRRRRRRASSRPSRRRGRGRRGPCRSGSGRPGTRSSGARTARRR